MSQPATATALTVLVVPHVRTEEILAVLGDFSAVGLLNAFAWVDAADVGGATTPATLVRAGRSEPVILQQLLTEERYERIRVAVLVPTEAPIAERAPLAAEQAVEQVARSSSMGAQVGLLRLLLTTGTAVPALPDPTLVLEGWHNLLLAPEDSAGPGLGAVPWGQLTDPLELARHVAPVIAGVAGLWAGLGRTPFDDLEILPGHTVRAVRAFYRCLDSNEVENVLRAQLFDPEARLPLPRGGQVPVVYVADVPAATQTMARALWTKHRDVLRGPRLAADDTGTQAISTWTAVKMFMRFMGTALRSAPSAWWGAVSGSVSSVLASTVQGTVFGGKESAFEVVTNTNVTSWQDLGRNADTLSSAIGGPGDSDHVAYQDLSALWTDYVNGALTLADGGRRAAGLDPIQIGSGVGVLSNAADVVPSAAERFTAIPTSLAAVVGMSTLEPADVLGAEMLAARLRRAYSDPAAGVEARAAGTDLEHWQGQSASSYAWQVSSILADFMNRARGEVARLADQIHQAATKVSADERLRARQRTIGIILKTFTFGLLGVLIVLAGIAGLGWAEWRFALITGGTFLAVYVVLSLALFLFAQRDLFAEMNLRRSQLSQMETMQANLRAALRDVSRLSAAYGQLLSWSRSLGTVLQAPFGIAPDAAAPPGQLFDGLPRSTQVGVAYPSDEQAADAIHAIQSRLYSLGWLTQPWQDMVGEAAQRLREDPDALFRMPGIGTGSGLDHWSTAVMSGRVRPTGAAALWTRVEQMFVEDAGIGNMLAGSVLIPTLGRAVAAPQFGAGVTDHRQGRAAPFEGSLFTNAATTAGRSAVAVDDVAITRSGLGYRASVIQASDGLPPYDFALFEAPVIMAPDAEDEVATMISSAQRPDTPPGEDMVF